MFNINKSFVEESVHITFNKTNNDLPKDKDEDAGNLETNPVNLMQQTSSLDNSKNLPEVESSQLDNRRQTNDNRLPDSPNQLPGFESSDQKEQISLLDQNSRIKKRCQRQSST